MSKVTIVLPDDSTMEVNKGDKVIDVAYQIGEGLGDDCVAGYVNGELVGEEYRIEDGDVVDIITEDDTRYVEVIRHTSAHVLAQSLKRLYDDIKLAIGPPTDDGFYYDIVGKSIQSSDLSEIEDEMTKIIEEDLDIDIVKKGREEALEYYEDNKFKTDILNKEAKDSETLTFYKQGEFMDLCKGGHLNSTGEIPAFKLLEVSGSYWRGDEDNDTLTRIRGTAFRSDSDLNEYIEKLEKAQNQNHRVIGQEMELFEFPDHSPAPQYLPKGMKLISEIKKYIRQKNEEMGYEEVWTPELNRSELFEMSGHYEAFCEDGEMFYWEQSETEYSLKPMNCANHASIYSSTVESYDDLPVKFSEFGTVYRHERSGSGSGLFRARGFTQDDGHSFVRPDQLTDEVNNTLRVIDDVLKDKFELNPTYKLETKPENALGSDEIWDEATEALRSALDKNDLEYDVKEGDGAFYGPKIGADVEDLLDREWTLGTVQVDFNIPRQMDLTYIDENNNKTNPIMIHRALIGSYERFLAVLLEQTEGILPTWVSPVQVRILTISEDYTEYARQISNELRGFRVEIDDSDETLGNKIRRGHDQKVSYMIILGEDEADQGTISLRDINENEIQNLELRKFKHFLRDEIINKDKVPSVVKKLEN